MNLINSEIMRLSIFILEIFPPYLVDVGNRPLLVWTMTLSKYRGDRDQGRDLHLLHPGGQGGVPDLLLGHVAAQLHAPELDHADKCGEGVTSGQRGGYRDVTTLERQQY